MSSEDMGCAITICFILLAAILLMLFYFNKQEYKKGYVQAVVDIEKNIPLKYKLVKQENGESIWELAK